MDTRNRAFALTAFVALAACTPPEFIAPEYVEVFNNQRYDVGIEGAKRHVRGVRETYPHLHLTIERQIAEGEWVVTQIIARGTQLVCATHFHRHAEQFNRELVLDKGRIARAG